MSKKTRQIFGNIASRLKSLRISRVQHETLSEEMTEEIPREYLVHFLGLLDLRVLVDLCTQAGRQLEIEMEPIDGQAEEIDRLKARVEELELQTVLLRRHFKAVSVEFKILLTDVHRTAAWTEAIANGDHRAMGVEFNDVVEGTT